jgi:O-acetyl-ADP-ribose deacetylase (regulator of RNase III)
MTSPLDTFRATAHRLFHLPHASIMPTKRVALQDLTLELWVSQRKLPLALRADAILVPVAPDLKMVFGIAKMARDMGADYVQHEAEKVAPLPPGDAFVGTGARFRYKYTALAVIFDQNKRTSPAIIGQAIGTALNKLRVLGVNSVVFPDMTENLLAQPNWITDEQRRTTAAITARLMVDAIIAGGLMGTVRIWVWDAKNASFFADELERVKKEHRAGQEPQI